MDKESFWVSPSHLQTDNTLQGQIYDAICEDNIILLQDLKERAIDFLQNNVHSNESHDFTHFLNSTNSSIFDIFWVLRDPIAKTILIRYRLRFSFHIAF